MGTTAQQLQSWLRDLSDHFIRLPAEEIGAGIEAGLREIIDFLDVDRSTHIEFTGEEPLLSATYSSAREGVQPFQPGSFVDIIPWYHRELVEGRTVILERIPDDLPAAATAEREYAARFGIRSNLTIPIMVGDRPTCALAVGTFRESRIWPEEFIDRLRIAGEILASA